MQFDWSVYRFCMAKQNCQFFPFDLLQPGIREWTLWQNQLLLWVSRCLAFLYTSKCRSTRRNQWMTVCVLQINGKGLPFHSLWFPRFCSWGWIELGAAGFPRLAWKSWASSLSAACICVLALLLFSSHRVPATHRRHSDKGPQNSNFKRRVPN